MMKYRVMTAEDYPEIYKLWVNTPGMGLNTLDDGEVGIRRYLARNPETSFVAEENGRIVGAIMAGNDGRRGYIHHTAVMPEYREKHVAQNLVQCAMSALENEGINKVALVAFRKNELGNGFWEHIGFTEREDLIYRNKIIHPMERIDT